MVLFLAVVSLVAGPVTARAQNLWTAKDGSIRDIEARAMAADEESEYLITRSGAYRAIRGDGSWRTIFSTPPGENELNCIGLSSGQIYIGTRRGLFRSQDRGSTWRNIFRAMTPEKADVRSISVSAQDPGNIIIGTGKGVFITADGGSRWRNISGSLGRASIKCVALGGDRVYAASDDGLYGMLDGSGEWEKIYPVLGPAIDGDSSAEEVSGTETPEEAEKSFNINCIVLIDNDLYIGAGSRIMHSDDRGKSWQEMPKTGLGGMVNDIISSPESGKLYCATTKGVFEYLKDENVFREIYRGMDRSPDVSRLFFDVRDSSLWALSQTGVYSLDTGAYMADQYVDVERAVASTNLIYKGEPTLKELREAALRYNDVGPEKIDRWRSQSRLKALLPQVNIGLDHGTSNTYEIYTSATKDYVVSGPDDISDGWDVSVSWELGDLIWSTDQTSIDVRSRLNTQLRNDILDDLRRLYYERKRLQYEMMNSPSGDLKMRFEKELRLRELTQAIDDLTGNYLSEHMGS
jgi:photosystem II stability/assembly factor-like uncharacterized protein